MTLFQSAAKRKITQEKCTLNAKVLELNWNRNIHWLTHQSHHRGEIGSHRE